MKLTYDMLTAAFLAKITEYDLYDLPQPDREMIVDEYRRMAVSAFRVCKYDLIGSRNDCDRCYDVDVDERDIDELINIISDGMLEQWMKPYLYKQELLENLINTRDFTSYSPAELLLRVGNAHEKARRNFINDIREYSFAHNDLTVLHM